ncbi:hypothetical protein PISMIDRAFT_28436 [Pisolithus microcarpus 441]|uniref:K Homology domain-containing protein n=1 Tax=Pisolithus microcarpus 441 TaxID=765257 RepID=A0A0C9YNG5_9AGAM|nr:hypothetical protein PISMIDRAFT_28436 [Pisolithus microcarpus 441]
MDVYSVSFTHPRRSRQHVSFDPHPRNNSEHFPLQHPLSHPVANQADNDTVEKLTKLATSLFNIQVSWLLADGGRSWNFHISGAYPQHRTAIKVPRADILDPPSTKPVLKQDVRRRLDEIASLTYAHIAVVNSPLSLSSRTPPDGVSSSVGWSGLETERVCELVITGSSDAVELARVRLLVMLDELSGLHAEPCEIDRKLHAVTAGRKRSVLQKIQEDTATNIYFPSPLQGLVGPEIITPSTVPQTPGQQHVTGVQAGPAQAQAYSPNVVWITGEFFGVQRAKDMLFQLSVQKSKAMQSRETVILPRKLDWMVLDRADDLKTIMSDNATFIQFPPIGSSTSLITVYGDHLVNVQRTIRSIMQLACQQYVGSFWLLPMQFNVLLPPSSLNPAQVATLLKQISLTTGAEVVFKSNCFEIHGLEYEVRAAVSTILDLDIVKPFHHEIRFQVELANEHREFISGKKNGKINKIMQSTGVKIKFETFNEHNFLIDLSGSDASVIQGLTLLQEELPAEISFHVPEAYHKRIIGIGGRNIQRIMKKYGVYVKFSNAEEFAALGGYNDNEDNVVARTPSKNAINLDNLKQSVMEIVNPKDKDYVNETLSIPRRYHRTLLGEKGIFIHDIEAKTNSKVRFPDKETASDLVTIFGPENQVQIAAAMLLEHVPFEADMAVPPSPDLPRVCASAEFGAFIERIKRDFQVSIMPSIKPTASAHTNGSSSSADQPSSQAQPAPGDCSFKFRCQRSNTDFLLAARELLEQFLLNHNVHVYPSATAHTHKRGDSFAEAFPHFDSKVLTARRHESVELSRSEILGDRRLRLANSSPDVKALFNAPPYIYDLDEREDSQEQISKPRSLQNRAQSLDLTYSLSRLTDSSARLPAPESPTTSTGGTGGNSSPTSATAPSFPSVYGPRSVIGSSAQRNARVRDSEDVTDEVSRVISNLGL